MSQSRNDLVVLEKEEKKKNSHQAELKEEFWLKALSLGVVELKYGANN